MQTAHFLDVYKKYFIDQEDRLLDDFFSFLRFETISADPEKRPQLLACAEWLEHKLKTAKFHVELWNKEHIPVVFAQYRTSIPNRPTLLIYNHYDVQPVDPIHLWNSPPFSPKKEGSCIYARGAQDNKGQCFYVLSALLAYLEIHKTFPINITYLIEGEEESGSAHLPEILREKKEQLKADHVLVVDLGMRSSTAPAITLGTRGLVSLEVEVSGTNTDLHSGIHGGLAYNPIHALVEMLAQIRDQNGQITIPGFYDNVIIPDKTTLSRIHLDYDIDMYNTQFGTAPTGGEKGYTPLERNWLRPTLEINGIYGGYQGPGGKTVIPAKAGAKITCRLVPHQDPLAIAHRIKSYLEAITPKGLSTHITIHEGHGAPVRTDPDAVIIKALRESMERVCTHSCEYIFEGASIPIVPELEQATQGLVAMFGFGLASDRIHAPNEHFGWDRMEKGFLTMCTLIDELSQHTT